jgi:hypothetical protein
MHHKMSKKQVYLWNFQFLGFLEGISAILHRISVDVIARLEIVNFVDYWAEIFLSYNVPNSAA